jgi:hypothetical protein
MSVIPQVKALVIDDQPAEALLALQALQLLGIGGLFYDGGINNPFGQRLPAPQLLLLDMVLAEHGADVNDEAGCRQFVFRAIDNITQLSSAPLVVICWSGHPTLFDDFKKEFVERFPNVEKAVFLRADKAEFFRPADPTALARLKEHVGSGLKELGLLGLLFEWELLVAKSAAITIQRVMTLAGNDRELEAIKPDLLTKNIDEVCGLLALAEGGTRIVGGKVDAADCVFDLFRVLQSLLLDRLEHNVPAGSLIPAYGTRLKEAAQRAKTAKDSHHRNLRKAAENQDELFAIWQNLGCDTAAACTVSNEGRDSSNPEPLHGLIVELNTMLLMTRDANGGTATPGTLYLLGKPAAKEDVQAGNIAKNKVIADTLRGIEQGTEQAVLVECTPSCDFSQNKRRLPRLVAGVLVALDQARDLPSHAEYLRQVGPLQLDPAKSSPPCMLVLNGHFVSGIAQLDLAKLSAAGRFRSSVLADITSWLGHQMARPGYVSL